jgi:multisubunit Na+/H+ antiporter MnhB subunit
VFAAVMLAVAVIFFLLGQSIENGGRIILSQSVYLVAGIASALFVVTILPGRDRHNR